MTVPERIKNAQATLSYPLSLWEDTALPRVFGISGGRSSAYMLYREMKKGIRPTDIFSFQNTGKENLATLDFLHEIETRWNVPIVWLEYDYTDKPTFKIVNYKTAARKGEPFALMISKKSYLPNVAHRICTYELKVKTLQRYLKHERGIESYNAITGMRYDEPLRIIKSDLSNLSGKNKYNNVLPLAEDGITKIDVRAFWNKQSFDLQLKEGEGNCDLCFLKGKNKLIRLLQLHPEKATWWKEQEAIMGNTFHKNHSYAELEAVALGQSQIPLQWNEIECIGCTD